jgi:hypothetical protein
MLASPSLLVNEGNSVNSIFILSWSIFFLLQTFRKSTYSILDLKMKKKLILSWWLKRNMKISLLWILLLLLQISSESVIQYFFIRSVSNFNLSWFMIFYDNKIKFSHISSTYFIWKYCVVCSEEDEINTYFLQISNSSSYQIVWHLS